MGSPWEQRKLGDFYFFKNGLNKEKKYFGQGTPIVNFVDVFHNRGLKSSDLQGKVSLTDKEIQNFQVKQGDIFFTRTSETIEEIGFPSVMLDNPTNTVFSGFVLRGRSKEGVQDPLENEFKKYVFFTEAFRSEMKKKSSMTTRALTSGTALSNMLMSYPSDPEEQSRIAELLSKLDVLISLQQKKLNLLKKTKQAYLQRMFPKNGENIPEFRFEGFTDPWEQRKLSSIAETFSGGTPKVGNKEYYGGEIPFIRSAEINSFETELFITEEGLKNSSAKMVNVGNILYALYGATSGEVGISKINGAINQAILAIIPKKNIETEYLHQWLRAMKDEIVGTYLQGGQGNLSGKIIQNLDIDLPSSLEQQQIGTFFHKLDETITLHQRKLDLLKQKRQSYLQNMFPGNGENEPRWRFKEFLEQEREEW